MKNKILLLLALSCFNWVVAQEIIFKTGKNFTSYDFKNSQQQSAVDYRSGSGDFYEIGYSSPIKNSKIKYIISVVCNQFNAEASNGATSYSWKTSYLGIQNMFLYEIVQTDKGFYLSLASGVNTTKCIKGEQFINTAYFDIKKHREFSGLFFQPSIGINANYSVSDKMVLSLGYQVSKAFTFSNSTDEKLSFLTNQIQFGIHFPIQ